MRDLAAGGVVVESAVSTRLGLAGVNEAAESLAVMRHVAIGAIADMRVHVGAISSGRSVDALHGVGAHVSPWHVLLDERAHLERRYDTSLRLDPPLPTASSRDALVRAVQAGAVAVSSGHRAVPNRTKDLEMAIAEAGASSLALTLPLLLGERVLTPLELARATSAVPARILGLDDRGKIDKGARADLVVLRADVDDVVDARVVGSRSPANPWLGRRIKARVERTMVAGRNAFERRQS